MLKNCQRTRNQNKVEDQLVNYIPVLQEFREKRSQESQNDGETSSLTLSPDPQNGLSEILLNDEPVIIESEE